VNLPQISVSQDDLSDFCQRHHIRKLAVFGSILRKDFGPDSDIDVLVEFEAGHIPGFTFFAIQDELAGLLGRDVDLNTSAFLSRHFRQRVQAEAVVLYGDD
jgi:predicted nucleotidyltransferase